MCYTSGSIRISHGIYGERRSMAVICRPPDMADRKSRTSSARRPLVHCSTPEHTVEPRVHWHRSISFGCTGACMGPSRTTGSRTLVTVRTEHPRPSWTMTIGLEMVGLRTECQRKVSNMRHMCERRGDGRGQEAPLCLGVAIRALESSVRMRLVSPPSSRLLRRRRSYQANGV